MLGDGSKPDPGDCAHGRVERHTLWRRKTDSQLAAPDHRKDPNRHRVDQRLINECEWKPGRVIRGVRRSGGFKAARRSAAKAVDEM
jgi:hypothetical protein